jgi:quercetin dioxygenase-like cupin family protein
MAEDRAEQEQKLSHTRWDDIPVEAMSSHIGRQFLVGTNTMLARLFLKKGATVPLHHHYHEQISYVLEGVLQFHVDGREIIVRAGEVLCIPPNAPHQAFALEDTVDLDIFNPPRQDWIDRDDAYLRRE